jgi:formyl-CoA transferase
MAERGMKITVRDPAGRPVDLIGSPFHIHDSPPAPAAMPPGLGQHTAEILREVLNLDEASIADLISKKII